MMLYANGCLSTENGVRQVESNGVKKKTKGTMDEELMNTKAASYATPHRLHREPSGPSP
jgi:hypothetical protein